MAIIRLPWVKGTQSRTVFVLGGGGNLGAIQVGMLLAAFDHGITPDVVVGCSAGAINGAAVAANPTREGVERLAQLWSEVPDTAMNNAGRFEAVRLLTRRAIALQSNEGLRALLEESVPYRRFEDFPIPLHVVATSLASGRERWFSTGEVVEPILASAALPGVFPPVVIDGDTLIDGGVVNNVPISKAYEMGASRIVVFHVGNFDRPRPVPKRPIEVIIQALSIARSSRFHVDITHTVADAVELVVLPGVDPGKLRYNDFTRSQELVERGRLATAAFLDQRLAATAR